MKRIALALICLLALVSIANACDGQAKEAKFNEIFGSRAPQSSEESEKIMAHMMSEGAAIQQLTADDKADEACAKMDEMISWISSYPAK